MKLIFFLMILFIIVLPFTFFIWTANEEKKSNCQRLTDAKVSYASSCVEKGL